ncbi:MAG: tetratricopeptide repeat protein [Verrucomicrobiota bacterium]|jgi:tetratricopeptide (TPR) repeat protein
MKAVNQSGPDRSQEMAAPRPNSRRAVLGVCLLLATVVFLVFGQSLRHEFVSYDDDGYFKSNHQVKAGLTWNGAQWAFRTTYASNWHPVTWLSLMLDAQLFGTGPAGPHLMNVLLHAANAVLLFLLLRRMMRLRSEASSPQVGLGCDKSVGTVAAQAGALWPSAFVAAVFAIHPLRVESVAWVAERKDVLSGLFFMLTLWAYARYAQTRARIQMSGVRWLGSYDYWLAVLFFALGLMSKPMLVTVPFVMLLLDWWPLERFTIYDLRFTIRRLIWEKVPFFGLSTASCVATVLAQREAIKSMIVLPLTLRFGNALMAYVAYLVQMVWPDNLAAFYPYRFDVPFWQIASAGTLLLFITLLAFRIARRFPYFITGWLWYLGMLVPVIGLVQVGDQSHADRYTYLPQIGLYLVMVWAVRDFTASWRYRRQVLGVAAFSVIAALIGCTWKQTAYWRNDESLWRHALASTSGNYIAYGSLGATLVDQGRFAEAIGYLQKAIEFKPNSAEVYNDWGKALMGQGQTAEAIKHFQKAVEIDPACAEAYNNLGNLLGAQGQAAEAIEYYQKAIELRPNRAEIYNNFGNLLAAQNRVTEAIEQFQKALEIKPDYAKAHYNLANIFTAQGRWDEAIEHYQRALEQMPDFTHAHYQLGLLLQSRGKFAAAIAQFQKVLELDPHHVTAQNNLAWLLSTCPDNSLRNGQKAVAVAQQAVQLSGGNSPEILDTLAAAYAEAGRFPEAIETARQALDLSTAQNKKPLAEVIQNQLKLFETHSPYHEKP